MNPEKLDKYLYTRKLRTWKVRTLYLFGIVSWLLVMYGYSGAITIDPFYKWFVAPILAVLTVYQLISFFLNLWYKQFDFKTHIQKTTAFWAKLRARNTTNDVVFIRQPSVDIFLPICGEDMATLRNTWKYVARMKYRNKKVYVLDDSATNCLEHEKLARQFGFYYLERPNKGEMKKAGNLKYAYERTNGEFIVILDADFAPHPDFILDTLPYMSDPKVGIVQTPQYFAPTKELYKNSPIAYGAARDQEIFYQIIQVARDRLGGAHCCGTCAVYRRAALKTIGGFFQMGHSEDAHTGFELTSKGWIVRYLPVILAVGMCPDNVYAFFHQQHRWCLGNAVLTLDKKFWAKHIPFKVQFCYLSGFFYNLHYPLIILFSFQLFWTLIIYNQYISLTGAILFYPNVLFSLVAYFLLPPSRFRLKAVFTHFIKAYSNSHAFYAIFMNRSVGWIATGAKHTNVSPAFRQTMYAVGLYIMAYSLLLGFALLGGFIHFLDVNYYSVQFWLFYNLAFSIILFLQMYKFSRSSKIMISS